MREKTMKRVNINLDQESLEILKWYKNQGKGYSFIIRLALALLRDTQDGTNS